MSQAYQTKAEKIQNTHREVPIYVFFAIEMDGGEALIETYATEDAARFRARQYVNQQFAGYLSHWIMDYDEAVDYALAEHRERVGVVERLLALY
jgi:hypothetical protein